jgi:hypothetical protein
MEMILANLGLPISRGRTTNHFLKTHLMVAGSEFRAPCYGCCKNNIARSFSHCTKADGFF